MAVASRSRLASGQLSDVSSQTAACGAVDDGPGAAHWGAGHEGASEIRVEFGAGLSYRSRLVSRGSRSASHDGAVVVLERRCCGRSCRRRTVTASAAIWRPASATTSPTTRGSASTWLLPGHRCMTPARRCGGCCAHRGARHSFEDAKIQTPPGRSRGRTTAACAASAWDTRGSARQWQALPHRRVVGVDRAQCRALVPCRGPVLTNHARGGRPTALALRAMALTRSLRHGIPR
jgi:hypothetical protein